MTMLGSVHTEVLLAAGYAVFLIVVALVLETVARFAHRRAECFRVSSFTYDPRLNVWECPAGERLFPTAPHRYRAPAHTCNACPLKLACTDSHSGREIVMSPLDWLETEVGRFHRGMSMGLLVLVGWLVGFEALRHRDPADLRVLGGVLMIAATLGVHLLKAMLQAKR
jgi:hypothetical protein